jgi:hypothetical protein
LIISANNYFGQEMAEIQEIDEIREIAEIEGDYANQPQLDHHVVNPHHHEH